MRLKGILILSLLTTFHFAVKAQLPPATELSTLNGFNGFKVESLASNYFATSASNIGDINGDGIDDFAFGDTLSSFNNENDGAVHVIFGNNEPFQNTLNINSLNGSNGVTFVGEQAFGQAGWSVNSAGDINDDGFDDFMIGGEDTIYLALAPHMLSMETQMVFLTRFHSPTWMVAMDSKFMGWLKMITLAVL